MLLSKRLRLCKRSYEFLLSSRIEKFPDGNVSADTVLKPPPLPEVGVIIIQFTY